MLTGKQAFDRWIKVKNRQHPAFSRVMEQFG
jgi:hypothetical protein